MASVMTFSPMTARARSILGIEALTLDDVCAGYGASQILHNLTFSVRQGEVLTMLGRNGVGKSTCMKCIVGLIPARSGSITLLGRRISGLSPEVIARAGIGYVPQGRRVFPSLTVQENLSVAARPGNGAIWSTERVFGEFPRLQERRNLRAGKLSGGEQQMLAVGRALVTNPAILMLDEPSEGLSPQIVSELRKLVIRLRDGGMTVLLVEQNLDFAFDVSDRVVIMNTARLSFVGASADLRNRTDFLNCELGVGTANAAPLHN